VITLSDASTLTWEDTAIIEASLIEEMSPICAVLPLSELKAQIYDADNKFSVFDDNEILAQRQEIDAWEVVDGLEYYLGRFYLDDWKSPTEETLEIKAFDIVGMMDTTSFDGYFFADLTPLSDILDIVLADIDAGYELGAGLSGRQLKGYIPAGTVREALQQVCFAARVMVITARRSDIGIVEASLPYAHDYHELDIGVNAKFMEQPTQLKPLVTGIELISHTYEQSADLEVVYEDTLAPGQYKIIFDDPTYLVSISGAAATEYHPLVTHSGAYLVTHDGAKLIKAADYKKGPNTITINVPAPGGVVTMLGYIWHDSQRLYRFIEDGDYTRANILKIADATLVSTNNAEYVLANLRDYYRGRYIHQMELVPMTGPRYGTEVYGDASYGWSTAYVKIGQMASVATLQGPYMRAVLEKMETDLTGGFLVDASAVGIKVAA
jgi:hypothetical protein